MKSSGINVGVLLVDNISPDSTLKRAQAAFEKHQFSNVTFLRNQNNYNLSASYVLKQLPGHITNQSSELHSETQVLIRNPI
jgi:hypothetical protein